MGLLPTMARFALLKHDHPFDHFDLLLQWGQSLKSWRLVIIPRVGEAQSASKIPDHRLNYLDYEGPVSGNRGHVQRVDGGELEWLHAEEDRVEAVVSGNLLRGRLLLERFDGDDWQLTWIDHLGPNR